MKSLLYLSLATAAAAIALPKPGFASTGDAIPQVQTLPAWNNKNAVVKKIRYGPFKLPAAKMKNGEIVPVDIKEIVPLATKPCAGECTIEMMAANIEYTNGTEAKDPGTYMHHAAVLNSGLGVTDGNCGRPGVDMFFSSGNEKSFVIFTDPDAKLDAGYYINPGHIFIMQTEVQNYEPIDKDIYIAISYQIIDNKKPALSSKVVWISADSVACDYVPPPGTKAPELNEDVGNMIPPNDKAFNLTSIDWVSPYEGEILACGGHMHNGGVWTKVYQNEKMFCDSVATYAPGLGTHMDMHRKREMSPNAGLDEYLQKMSGCVMPGKIQKGDKIKMTAAYDFEQHAGMRAADGKLAPIMALATCFIAAKQ